MLDPLPVAGFEVSGSENKFYLFFTHLDSYSPQTVGQNWDHIS